MTATGGRRALRASVTDPLAVAVGSGLANVVAYALSVALARQLSSAEFGATIAVLGLFLVASVPGLALQTALARESARRAAAGAGEPLLGLRDAATPTVVVAFSTLLLAPLVVVLARIDSVGAVVGFVLSTLAISVMFALQGLVQGRYRFRALAVLLFLAGASRCTGGLVGLSHGVTGVLLGHGIGLCLGAAAAVLVTRHELRLAPVVARPAAAAPPELPALALPERAGVWRVLALGVVGIGGFFVLANADVVMARHVLAPDDAGSYAAGALVEKIGLWLPQFVALVATPALADRHRRSGSLRLAVAETGAITAALVVGCLVLGGWAVRVFLGEQYAEIADRTALFAAMGGGMALVYVLLIAGLAAGDRTLGLTTWAALACFVTLALLISPSLTRLAVTFLCCVWTLVALGLWVERRDLLPGRSAVARSVG